MYTSTFFKTIICTLLFASLHGGEQQSHPRVDCSTASPMTRKKEQKNRIQQSYSNITTHNGVLEFMENTLDLHKVNPAHKAIFIDQLTGKNDLLTTDSSTLQSLVKNIQEGKNKTITLNDVALYLDNGKITILFKLNDKAQTGVRIKYNLHDEETSTFKQGLSRLKTVSKKKFDAAVHSMKQLKHESEQKFHEQWKWLKAKMNRYFKKAKHTFNNITGNDKPSDEPTKPDVEVTPSTSTEASSGSSTKKIDLISQNKKDELCPCCHKSHA